jgi:hypothetical protein
MWLLLCAQVLAALLRDGSLHCDDLVPVLGDFPMYCSSFCRPSAPLHLCVPVPQGQVQWHKLRGALSEAHLELPPAKTRGFSSGDAKSEVVGSEHGLGAVPLELNPLLAALSQAAGGPATTG